MQLFLSRDTFSWCPEGNHLQAGFNGHKYACLDLQTAFDAFCKFISFYTDQETQLYEYIISEHGINKRVIGTLILEAQQSESALVGHLRWQKQQFVLSFDLWDLIYI